MTTKRLSAVALLACSCLAIAGFTVALYAASDPVPGGNDPPPPPPPPPITVDDVQAFFEQSIVDGTLDGSDRGGVGGGVAHLGANRPGGGKRDSDNGKGRGFWPDFNLCYMDYVLEQAVLAHEDLDTEGTFRWLAYAYLCCDGTDCPTYDLVEGSATSELKGKIKEVMAGL